MLDPEQRVSLRQVLSARWGALDRAALHPPDRGRGSAVRPGRRSRLGPGPLRRAVPDLVATASGRVWLADAPRPGGAGLVADRRGAAPQRRRGRPPGAELTEPTLEDGYLLLLGDAAHRRRVGGVTDVVARPAPCQRPSTLAPRAGGDEKLQRYTQHPLFLLRIGLLVSRSIAFLERSRHPHVHRLPVVPTFTLSVLEVLIGFSLVPVDVPSSDAPVEAVPADRVLPTAPSLSGLPSTRCVGLRLGPGRCTSPPVPRVTRVSAPPSASAFLIANTL